MSKMCWNLGKKETLFLMMFHAKCSFLSDKYNQAKFSFLSEKIHEHKYRQINAKCDVFLDCLTIIGQS